MAEMPDFNIQTLANFEPPRRLCWKCLALLRSTTEQGEKWKCPVCSVEYTSGQKFTDVGPFLNHLGLGLEFGNLLEHGKALATVTLPRDNDNGLWGNPTDPLGVLLQTISLAKHFVHFHLVRNQ